MPTCNRLDLQTLGSQPIMSKNLPARVTRVRTAARPTQLRKKHYLCILEGRILGSLHTQAKSRDHEMVKAFDYHPKAIPWVLGYPFCVGTGPQT